ncbi:hypothetical protein BGX23_008093 [Mortierella sp. AD031]|nr:hypothetical protein BGX23_008093 [Mortierella sp. AD031]KAG0204699.1 hypothetical protein BGX33_008312 [Mortierella sp. NVP41]
MPAVPSGRLRLKHAANLINHHLSDLNILFEPQLRESVGPSGTEYVNIAYLQDAIPELKDLNETQVRRAVKYDAVDRLELHPEESQVRRCRPFDETEAVDRMLFVDDIDISGHEDDPTAIFRQLLLPYPGEHQADSSSTHHSDNSSTHSHEDNDNDNNGSSDDDDNNNDDPSQQTSQESIDHQILNNQTIIRPYGYKPTRFFQGFCYVEFPSTDLCRQMSSRILSRNNSVRVMPMRQWRKLESEYLSLRTKAH